MGVLSLITATFKFFYFLNDRDEFYDFEKVVGESHFDSTKMWLGLLCVLAAGTLICTGMLVYGIVKVRSLHFPFERNQCAKCLFYVQHRRKFMVPYLVIISIRSVLMALFIADVFLEDGTFSTFAYHLLIIEECKC